jgi:hypothetical protein
MPIRTGVFSLVASAGVDASLVAIAVFSGAGVVAAGGAAVSSFVAVGGMKLSCQ